jgi:hypothetical protein
MLYLMKVATRDNIRDGTAYGLAYFIDMFRDRVQAYITTLLAGKKPKKIYVCMIYFPDEQAGGSWADFTLQALGYNADPQKLQILIETAFRLATSRIVIDGCCVVPVPLFRVMDSKNSADYVARVEPSGLGGLKIAKWIVDDFASNSFEQPQGEPSQGPGANGCHLL